MESLQAAQTDIEKVVAINFKTRYFAAVRVKIILSSLDILLHPQWLGKYIHSKDKICIHLSKN